MPAVKAKRTPTCSLERRGLIAAAVQAALPGIEVSWTSGHGVFRTTGKTFASITREGDLALRLPEDRIEELIGLGEARRFTFGQRIVEGSVVIPATPEPETLSLLREAKAFALLSQPSKPAKRTRQR
jgi:hypothetical protein